MQTPHFILLPFEQPQLRGDHVVEISRFVTLQLLFAIFYDSKFPKGFPHCWGNTYNFGQSLEETVVQFSFVGFTHQSVVNMPVYFKHKGVYQVIHAGDSVFSQGKNDVAELPHREVILRLVFMG